MEALIDDLVNAEEVVFRNPPDTRQYILLDRPEGARGALPERMDRFLRVRGGGHGWR